MLAVLDATAAADPTAHWVGPWFPWFLIFPLFWILALGLFFFLGRRFWWGRRGQGAEAGRFGPGRYPGPFPTGPAAAEEILRERYARGDIDETEYRQRLEVLRGAEPGPYYQP